MSNNIPAILDGDIMSVADAHRVIKQYKLTDFDYYAIETRRQAEADAQRLISCEKALDDAYECFTVRGGRYEE